MIENTPSTYQSSNYSSDTLPSSNHRNSIAFSPSTTTTTPFYLNYKSLNHHNNNNSSSSSLRQSLSSSRLNNSSSSNNNNNNIGSRYSRLSRHFSFDDDDSNDTTFSPASSLSYMSPENYVTLTRRNRRDADQPSVIEKYFSPSSTKTSRSTSSVTSQPLSRQSSSAALEASSLQHRF